jgi:hypothetical protein
MTFLGFVLRTLIETLEPGSCDVYSQHSPKGGLGWASSCCGWWPRLPL